MIVDHFVHGGKTKVHARPTPQHSHCERVCVLCVGVRACVQLHPPLSLSVSASRVECINRPDLQCMDSADWNVCSYQIFERLV